MVYTSMFFCNLDFPNITTHFPLWAIKKSGRHYLDSVVPPTTKLGGNSISHKIEDRRINVAACQATK